MNNIKNARYKKLSAVFIFCILGIVALIQVFPFYWMLTFSLKDNAEIFGGNVAGLPSKIHFENYIKAFTTGNISIYLINSVIATGVTILVSDILACMAAYAITRMKWRLNKKAQAFFLLGYMIPMHATLLPLMIILKNMNILNTRISLILPFIAFALPFAIYILSGFMPSIPRELEEAAGIDGCSIYQVFFKIILPIIKPAIATISIFTFLSCWNDLMFSMTFISKDALRTLNYGIMLFQGQYSIDWGTVGAGLTIATFPTLVFYLIFSEYFQKGIISGAVKG